MICQTDSGEWDTEKQTYWVLRRGDPWKVMNVFTKKYVADYPKYCYEDSLLRKICFAESDEEVVEILTMEKYR